MRELKYLFLLVILNLIVFSGYSQFVRLADSQAFEIDTTKLVLPSYKGGQEKLLRDLVKHLEYPTLAMEQGIQGQVVLSFLVDEKGRVSDVRVVKSVHPLLDEAAIKAVKKLKRFKSGYYEGKPVKLWLTIPITFKLTYADYSEL